MTAHAVTHIPILMVDHDQTQCEMVTTYLKAMGYDVTSVYNGTEGLERFIAEPEKWKVIILDVMLPGLDGFEVLKQIRAISHIPVIMHTARGDEMDRIVGLEIGADDYLPKTFSKRELLARLRAVLRRTNAHAAPKPPPRREPAELISGPLRLDTRSRHAEIDGVALMLTPVEFDLLASLVKASGRVKTREGRAARVASSAHSRSDSRIGAAACPAISGPGSSTTSRVSRFSRQRPTGSERALSRCLRRNARSLASSSSMSKGLVR